MNRIIWIVLFMNCGLLLAQNKTVITVNGERITHDPRISTAHRDSLYAVTPPIKGYQIFNTTTNSHEFWDGSGWYNFRWNGKINPATGGTSLVTSYSAGTASGIMKVGTEVDATVRQTITADVAVKGSYKITSTINGVIFTASGTFTEEGANVILLNASGTPTTPGNNKFYINSTENFFNRTVLAPDDVIGVAGRVWKDKNLGAAQVATSPTDHLAYGSLYQWGRGTDGHHEVVWNSPTSGSSQKGATFDLSDTDSPLDDQYIMINGGNYDWRKTSNNGLWKGNVQGLNNNPCPSGYQIPTIAEWTTELLAAGVNNKDAAYQSPLKLVAAGFRTNIGAFSDVSTGGYYWTSSAEGFQARKIYFGTQASNYSSSFRVYAMSIRCIKELEP